MKKILISFLIPLVGCVDSDYTIVKSEVVKGIVSAKEEGHTGRSATLPIIYVQSPKQTIHFGIPFANENDFKIGDSICVVVQQVEKTK
jgi:hypothetical protein